MNETGYYDYLLERRDAVLSGARVSPRARARIMGKPFNLVPPPRKPEPAKVEADTPTEPKVSVPSGPKPIDVARLHHQIAAKDRRIDELERQLGIGKDDKPVPVADVQKAFCVLLEEIGYRVRGLPLTVEDLKNPSRHRNCAWPRHVCIDAVRKICRASTTIIGRSFGKRDHTSVMHALNRTPHHLGAIPEFAVVHAKLLSLYGIEQ